MKWSCELDLKYLTAEVKWVIPFIESIHNPSLYLISEWVLKDTILVSGFVISFVELLNPVPPNFTKHHMNAKCIEHVL